MTSSTAIIGDINALPAGVLYVDHFGLIIASNQRFNEWVGIDNSIVGKHFNEIISGAGRIFNLTHIQPALQNQGHIEEMFLHLKSVDKTLLSVVLNAHRTASCDVFVFLPMTKRQQFESELMVARKEAELATSSAEAAYKALEALQTELTEKNKQLEELASTDPLTGLHNRRYFQSTLDREMGNLKDTGEPVSLVLIDIDHFKEINDTHGHDMGDQTLEVLGDLLTANMRQCEYVSRIGGEEFAVVLPQQTGEQALQFAERIRLSVEGQKFPTGRVTISQGIAQAKVGEGVQGLYMRADTALYDAKRAGRNCVVLSS